MINDMRWVRDAAPACQATGCAYIIAVRVQAAAQAIIDGRQQLMQYEGTLALWCSRGHSFSELDPGRIIIPAASGRDQDGAEITIPAQAVCGYHADGMRDRQTRPAELVRPRRALFSKAEQDKAERDAHYDPVRTKQLEDELGMTHSPTDG